MFSLKTGCDLAEADRVGDGKLTARRNETRMSSIRRGLHCINGGPGRQSGNRAAVDPYFQRAKIKRLAIAVEGIPFKGYGAGFLLAELNGLDDFAACIEEVDGEIGGDLG